jgi:hypothetical protein
MKNTQSSLKLNSNFISKRRANGDILLVSLDDSQVYFTIQGLAIEVWDKLNAGNKLEEIEESLCARFPNDKDEMSKLIKSFIKDLKKHEIISIQNK